MDGDRFETKPKGNKRVAIKSWQPRWKEKLREECVRRVQKNRAELLWQLRQSQGVNTRPDQAGKNVISSAFGFIISNEVGRLQNRNEAERGEENGPCQAHEEEHQNPSCQSNAGPMVGSEAKEQAMEVDMLWEFDRRVPDDHRAGPRCYSYPQPPDELNNEEYEELLLTMERALYEDLRQEAEREEARTIREFEISHAMEDAVFLDAVDRFEEDKESGVVICPLCKEKYVRQCGPVLFCECRQFRLDTQDRKVNLAFLQSRLCEVCEEHTDSGCGGQPSFSMKEQLGIRALWMNCLFCGALQVVV